MAKVSTRSTTSEYQPAPPFFTLKTKGAGYSSSAMPANGYTAATTANNIKANACCAPTDATTGTMPRITSRFSS